MKILITYVYSNHNKGDAALLSVLLSDIYRAFDKPDITILTVDKVEKDETFEGTPIESSFMFYARERYNNLLLRTIYASFVTASTLLWATVYRSTGKKFSLPSHLQKIAVLYQEADLIIPVGGGYIRSKKGISATINMFFFVVHPFLFSDILDKPTINYTQSIGPFGSKLQESMAKFVVKRLDGVIIR